MLSITLEDFNNYAIILAPPDNLVRTRCIVPADAETNRLKFVFTRYGQAPFSISLPTAQRAAINGIRNFDQVPNYQPAGVRNPPNIQYGEGPRRPLYPSRTLRGLCRLNIEKVGIFDPGHGANFNLNLFLSLFARLPDFDIHYQEYLLDRDIDTRLVEENDEDAQRFFQERVARENGAKTIGESDLTLLMAVLSMSKTYPENGQFENVVVNRLGALKANMTYPELSIDRARLIMDFESMSRLSESLTTYPKLKVMLYGLIMEANTALTQHIKPLLSQTQLTVFNLIVMFTEEPIKTVAHVHSKILPELRLFRQVLASIKGRYGDEYMFLKLFEPNNVETSVRQWPILAGTAFLYACIKTGDESLRQLRVTRSFSRLNMSRCLATELPPDVHLEPYEDLGRSADLLRAIGLNARDITRELLQGLVADAQLEGSYNELLQDMDRRRDRRQQNERQGGAPARNN